LSAELKAKQDAKYDHDMELDITAWIEETRGKDKPEGKTFHEWLVSGVILCRLINKMYPHTIKKISKSKMPFPRMNNISAFLTGCRKHGVAEHSCFSTVDLYEAKNLMAVLITLDALRKHRGGRKMKVKSSKDRMGGCGGFDISNKKIKSTGRFDQISGGADATAGRLERDKGNTTSFAKSAVQKASAASGQRRSTEREYADKEEGYDGSFGLSAEVRAKMDAKYDYELEEVVQEWIEGIVGEPFEASFADSLQNGVILCNLINAIPGKQKKIPRKKISHKSQKFSQMGNINLFLLAARQWGLSEHSLFTTVDLHEQKNMMSVLVCLDSIRRGAGGRKMGIHKQEMASAFDNSIRVQKGSARLDNINTNVKYS